MSESYDDIIGSSDLFLDFQEKLSMVAPVERPVLIVGERGTGKELAARRIHYLSKRWDRKMVTLNCAALSPTLIESELFGHEKGAFTGAESSRRGRFEEADGGTLFLDEIGLIPIVAQEKILRAVEYGSFERVGGSESFQVNTRIIGATNLDLKEMVQEGRFKADLLDRLSFEVLFVPPLRVRAEDILVLANHFAGRFSYELGRDELPEITALARGKIAAYSWPGNVRELKNVIERAVYKAESSMIDDVEVDPFVSPYATFVQEPKKNDIKKETEVTESAPATFSEKVNQFEASLVHDAMDSVRYNQKKAAANLGLSYDQFRRLYKKYGKKPLKSEIV